MNSSFFGFSMFLFSIYALTFHVSQKTPGTLQNSMYIFAISFHLDMFTHEHKENPKIIN